MVELAQDERDELEAVLKSSTRCAASATKLQRARILLVVNQGGTGPALTDGQVVDALGVTERTCQHVRRRASACGGAGSDDGSGAQASTGAEEAGRGEGSASGSGGLFGGP